MAGTSICDYLEVEADHSPVCLPASRPSNRQNRVELDESNIIKYDDIDMADCKIIGKGAVGTVVRARWGNQDVAVKMLRDFVADRSLRGRRAAIAKKDFHQEMYIVSQKLRHPNLVQALGICADDALSCMIVFEYVHGGSLDDVLFKKKRFGQPFRPSKKLSLQWCKQLASSLEYLHSRKPCIIHRDVKPSNILITHDMKTLKLTDLGLATSRCDDENRRMTGLTGSHCFMAPEVYKDEGSYTERVDIFSAAMVMWCIATGRRPAEGRDDRIFTALSSIGVTPGLGQVKPAALRPILTDAWALDPARRPSASELVVRLEALIASRHGALKRLCRNISSRLFRAPPAPADASVSSLSSDADLTDATEQTYSSRRTLASAECTEKTGEGTNWLEESPAAASAEGRAAV